MTSTTHLSFWRERWSSIPVVAVDNWSKVEGVACLDHTLFFLARMPAMDPDDNAARQLDELQALNAIFEGGLRATHPDVQRWIDRGEADGTVQLPDAAGVVELVLALPLDPPATPTAAAAAAALPPQALVAELRIMLPPGYPSNAPAACTVCCHHRVLGVEAESAVNTELSDLTVTAAVEGDECLFGLAEHAKAAAEAGLAAAVAWVAARGGSSTGAAPGAPLLVPGVAGGGGEGCGDGGQEVGSAAAAARIGRTFFWTHHTRRKQLLIYEWAKELGVSGVITVSKPGYTFVEATVADMREFTQRNMAEHWKEIRITWQEEADDRLFKDGLREVTIEQFVAELRSRGRDDILEAGTRGAVGRKRQG